MSTVYNPPWYTFSKLDVIPLESLKFVLRCPQYMFTPGVSSFIRIFRNKVEIDFRDDYCYCHKMSG